MDLIIFTPEEDWGHHQVHLQQEFPCCFSSAASIFPPGSRALRWM